MGVLGNALRLNRQPEEALPMLEACLALRRRYWPRSVGMILSAQTNIASCLSALGRHDEALVLKREVYARRVATRGISHLDTIFTASNIVASMLSLELWDEAKSLGRDHLLPVARQSLGADHDETLKINHRLAAALVDHPESTRDHPRFESTPIRAGQKTDLNTGDDLLEAETIMQDVVQRRRRVFGPAHPDTRFAEGALSLMREDLAHE